MLNENFDRDYYMNSKNAFEDDIGQSKNAYDGVINQ
jgi:hypothetical protein